MSFENPSLRPENIQLEDAPRMEKLRADSYEIPPNFEQENEDYFEPEYMRVLSSRERHKALQELFTHKMMEWLEGPDDASLENALRENEFMKEATRFVSSAYAEIGLITEEQRAAKLKLIGIEEPLLPETPL